MMNGLLNRKPNPWKQGFWFLLMYYLNILVLIFVVPAFADLFAGFGADLPSITILFTKYHIRLAYLLFALQLILMVYLAVIYSKFVDNMSYIAFNIQYACILVFGVLFLVCIAIAMYLPILNMKVAS